MNTYAKTAVHAKPSIFTPTRELAEFIALLAIVSGAPLLIPFQPITGTLVNAALMIAAVLLGSVEAVVIGFLPSIIALTVGQLPFALAPMVPFIIAGNSVLIVAFSRFWRRQFFLGVGAGAVAKFLFLYGAMWVGLKTFLAGSAIARAASVMLSWPQLATALAGGIIAYVFLKSIKKIK